MARLERLILAHEKYWAGQTSPLTDVQYDQEIEWLKKEHPDHWLITAIGGKQKCGKVRHEEPMLSLNKAYSFEEIQKFVKNTARSKQEKYLCFAKFDGLAAKWHNGTLSTRGNGEVGEDITDKIPFIDFIKKDQRYSFAETISLHARFGEIICPRSVFRNFGEGYKHPRNFVIGMIGRKGALPDGLKLNFVEYRSSPCYEFEAANFTESLWQEVVSFFDEYSTYPKDGIVIKIADEEYFDELGVTTHHPLGAVAFKFANEQTESKLLSVDWQCGKHKITPVANIVPVELGGVLNKRATLHCYKNVNEIDLHIGDDIILERAGDVIPYISLAVKTKESKNKVKIEYCPVCGSDIEIKGANVYCLNNFCPGKSLARLLAAIKELEIDFVGETTLIQIIGKTGRNSIGSFLQIELSELANDCGLGEKTAQKIYNSIQQRSQNVTPERFLAALNIEGVGRTTWRTILKVFTFDKIIGEKLSPQELAKISGIGPLTARKIRQGLIAKKDEINEFLSAVEMGIQKVSETQDKTICFTGKMPEKRSYYEHLAQRFGFQAVDHVTKELSLLVCDDVNSPSSKTKTAKKLGVAIMSLEDWLKEGQKC